jgi:KaiC/GvpD/RAD55 family RecA-like ATPase
MSRVTFKFNKKGTERKMSTMLADILYRKGMGTYMTRDLQAEAKQTARTLPNMTAVEVDSAGDAWNPDLHVASKLKNQNGTWRKKPGAAAHAAEESGE